MELANVLRPITAEQAKQSYEDLVALDCSKHPQFSRAGLKTLDRFFFGHRLKAKTKSHISFLDALKRPELVTKLHGLVEKYKKRSLTSYTPPDLLRAMYSVFQLYYGSINQFRPALAKWVYCTIPTSTPRCILDFSAGWGGRALAAASLGIPYIGYDANIKLKSAYEKLIRFIDTDVLRVQFKPSESVDFSKHKYDFVFTSPPYFMIEEYESMPAYGSKTAFLEQFFRPVVGNVWKYLLPGGSMALNMPEEMYDAVKDILPPLSKKVLMPISNRHPTNASRGQSFGKADEERHEYIYVWRKVRRQTRRKKRGASVR